MELNHIRGKSNSIIYFNLIYDSEIIGSLSLGKHHRQNFNNKEIILNRLCFKDGVSVIGGAEKLFNQAKLWSKANGYNKIISWSENSLSYGDVYKKLNFNLAQELKPDYFYWDKKIINIYLNNRRKNLLQKDQIILMKEISLYLIICIEYGIVEKLDGNLIYKKSQISLGFFIIYSFTYQVAEITSIEEAAQSFRTTIPTSS